MLAITLDKIEIKSEKLEEKLEVINTITKITQPSVDSKFSQYLLSMTIHVININVNKVLTICLFRLDYWIILLLIKYFNLISFR